jgi:hemerythrin-like domain-containing protein
MNRATANLENDHLQILQLIAVMEEIVKEIEPNVSHLEEVVALIRQFADGLHHHKEEELLFPLMANNGFSPTQGPVAVMLAEHEQGRIYVRNMAENIDLYKNGQTRNLAFIYSNMLGYTELLTNHIAKENNILFRMADKVFTRENQESLLGAFHAIDSGSVGGISAEDCVIRIKALTNIYLKTN